MVSLYFQDEHDMSIANELGAAVSVKLNSEDATVAKALKRKNYAPIVSSLMKRRGFHQQSLRHIQKVLRRELTLVSKNDKLMVAQKPNLKSLEKISWPVIVKELRSHAPTLVKLLGAMLTSEFAEGELYRDNTKPQIMLGVISSMILNSNHRNKMTLFQGLLSLEMFRGGGGMM